MPMDPSRRALVQAEREKKTPELRQAEALEQIAETLTDIKVELTHSKSSLGLIASALNKGGRAVY